MEGMREKKKVAENSLLALKHRRWRSIPRRNDPPNPKGDTLPLPGVTPPLEHWVKLALCQILRVCHATPRVMALFWKFMMHKWHFKYRSGWRFIFNLWTSQERGLYRVAGGLTPWSSSTDTDMATKPKKKKWDLESMFMCRGGDIMITCIWSMIRTKLKKTTAQKPLFLCKLAKILVFPDLYCLSCECTERERVNARYKEYVALYIYIFLSPSVCERERERQRERSRSNFPYHPTLTTVLYHCLMFTCLNFRPLSCQISCKASL